MKIASIEQLREFYDQPKGRAIKKELKELEDHCRNFLAKSPFMILSSVNKNGKQDASPRGGSPGFTKVLNKNQILLADAKGNNRLDTLSNIIETGEVGALFLIPGIQETLRLNGKAEIRTDKKYIDLFNEEQNLPKTCILITVDIAFLHCAKALMRSDLWGESFKISQENFPTMGQMLKDQLQSEGKVESHAEMVERYKSDL